MAITAYSQQQVGNVTIVTVTSGLSGTIYYHWYLDGLWQGVTQAPSKSFVLGVGKQARIEVNDTNDVDYDGPANAPTAYPAVRTLTWIRSLASDVACYRVEQQQDGGDWNTIGTVQRNGAQWEYRFTTPALDDLSTYDWRVYPIDETGNDGTVLNLDGELIVRTPDSPDYTVTFDSGTTKVAFAEAA